MASSKDCREAASDGVWVIANMALYIAGTVLFTTIWAGVGFAMFGNLGGRVSTDNFPNTYGTFGTMLTLMTTNNYPDVQLPYFRISPLFQIYFILIMVICFYGFINGVIPGLVAVSYHECLEEEAKLQFTLERNALVCVFGSIQENGGTTLSKEELMKVYSEIGRLWQKTRWWQRLMDRNKRARPPGADQTALAKSALRIYSEIDKDGSGTVEVKEFVDFCRDALDQEILRGFEAKVEAVDENMSKPVRQCLRGICSSPAFTLASAILCVTTVVLQFQILEFLLVLEVPFNGQFRAFWYVDWLLLALAGAEAAISRFSRGGHMKWSEYILILCTVSSKLLAQLVIVLCCFLSSDSSAPLFPMIRAAGCARLLRFCLMLRMLGPLQIFGVVPHSLETMGLFATISRDMGRLLACILALGQFYSLLGMYIFLGVFSSDNLSLAGSSYDKAGYYDFANFDSWLAALNTVFYITVDNNWNTMADAGALAVGYNSAWGFFLAIYFSFGSVCLNIFMCMFMDLYAAVEKEKKHGGQKVLSSLSVTHRMLRNEVRAGFDIDD